MIGHGRDRAGMHLQHTYMQLHHVASHIVLHVSFGAPGRVRVTCVVWGVRSGSAGGVRLLQICYMFHKPGSGTVETVVVIVGGIRLL